MPDELSEDDNISSAPSTPPNPFLEAQQRLAAYQAANPNMGEPQQQQYPQQPEQPHYQQQSPYMPTMGQQGFPQQGQYPPQQNYPPTYFATPPPKKKGKLIYGFIASGLVLALFIAGGVVITNLISAKNSTSLTANSKIVKLTTDSNLSTAPQLVCRFFLRIWRME